MKKYLTIIFCFLAFNVAAQKQINIVYFNTFKPVLMANITAALQGVYKCKIVQQGQIKLPKSAHYKPRNRYRADSLIDYLAKPDKNICIVGITTKDISSTKGNRTDWGVMGLSTRNTCVASSYRTRTTSQLTKVVVHEVGHGFGLPHCLDAKCVMNAGNATLRNLDFVNMELCSRCKQTIGL